jgi:DNA-binding GntR family transcriptional regulator
MQNHYHLIKQAILEVVSAASDRRLRPHELERTLSHRLAVSRPAVHQAIRELVGEGRLAYTYRDPTSYVELVEGLSFV